MTPQNREVDLDLLPSFPAASLPPLLLRSSAQLCVAVAGRESSHEGDKTKTTAAGG